MSKYDEAICAFCEKPMTGVAEEREWDRLWVACGCNDDDAELVAWADQYCWYGWDQPGECRNGMSIEDRLIEALEQRDAAREQLGGERCK